MTEITNTLSDFLTKTQETSNLPSTEQEWLDFARKVKSEHKLFSLRVDAIAAMILWIADGKPEYRFPDSASEEVTLHFDSEDSKLGVGQQGAFLGNGEEGVKFYYRPWSNLQFDYGTSPWKGGIAESVILPILAKNDLPVPKLKSWGWVSHQDWPHYTTLDTETRRKDEILRAYLLRNDNVMTLREFRDDNDVFALHMEDLGDIGELSVVTAEAEALYANATAVAKEFGIAITDAYTKKTVKQTKNGLVLLDFGFAEALTEQGLQLLLSLVPDKEMRNYCYHWHKTFKLPKTQ